MLTRSLGMLALRVNMGPVNSVLTDQQFWQAKNEQAQRDIRIESGKSATGVIQ